MNTATHINLRALRHPLTLASIALLLINDHWFKAAAPSFLTGKLSDFAGLFFFPFLLAALLSAARLPARATFVLALTLTGGWFALMKTTLWANALTRAVLSAVWGGPVSIVLDPTDCWALVMLFPAWLLWRNLERERAPQPPGKLALAALGVAVLASAASTCTPVPTIIRLASDGSILFVREIQGWRGDSILSSSDGGLTWVESVLTQAISNTLASQVSYPVMVCMPENQAVCYRLPDASRIEKSSDGGQSWQTDWQIPWGRLAYMHRVIRFPPSCTPDPDINLNDLVLVQTSNGHQVIAAMGNQGLLILKEGQAWERRAFYEARPIPWAAVFLDFLVSTFAELFASLMLGLVIWLLASSALWTEIAWRKHHGFVAAGIGWIITLTLVGGLGWYFQYFAQPSLDTVLINLPILVVASVFSTPQIGLLYLFSLLALGWSWGCSIKHAPNPQAASKLASQITGLALGLLLIGWLPFVLWAFGIIPLYETALALAAGLIMILLWRTWPKIISLRQQALTPPAV